MAHQRKSEQNRVLGEGIDSEIPWGLPSDDAHPDGEQHSGSTPPGAPEPGSIKSGESIDSTKQPKSSIQGTGRKPEDKEREKAA